MLCPSPQSRQVSYLVDVLANDCFSPVVGSTKFMRLPDTCVEMLTVEGQKLVYAIWALESTAFAAKLSSKLSEQVCGLLAGLESQNEAAAATAEVATVFSPEVPGWQCAICTLINQLADNDCSACGTRRADIVEGSPAADNPGLSAGWWCPNCTYINGLTVTE